MVITTFVNPIVPGSLVIEFLPTTLEAMDSTPAHQVAARGDSCPVFL